MRFSEDKMASLLCSDQVERPIHIWQPAAPGQPRAVILAIHGGMAHAGDYVTPALFFRQHGIATVSFDMVGHDGKRKVDIPSFEAFLDDEELFLAWVKATYPGVPIFVMGHSMGGLIATHLGLRRFAGEPAIQGFVLSSPYYVNAIPVPKLMQMLSGWLARHFPTMKVPLGNLTMLLTHDQTITARHFQDERDGIRASAATVRFAHALLSAQKALAGGLSGWRFPLFAVVAGDDKLASSRATESMLRSVPEGLLEYHFYPANYHENFNEVNRDAIFAAILAWMEKLLAQDRREAAVSL